MKTVISINDFTFETAGHGHYRVTYTSPVTGKSWTKTTSNMPLIDATRNSDNPMISSLVVLKNVCKHYSYPARLTSGTKQIIMKEQIKQVQDYFKAKLLGGDFEIKGIGEFTMELMVDGEYSFVVWIGNPNVPDSTKPTHGSFMIFKMTDEEAIELDKVLRPFVNKYKLEILLDQKTRQLEQLQNELKNL